MTALGLAGVVWCSESGEIKGISHHPQIGYTIHAAFSKTYYLFKTGTRISALPRICLSALRPED
jgi:hypothetical protein